MMMRFYNSRVEHIATKNNEFFLSSVTTLLFFIVMVNDIFIYLKDDSRLTHGS